jgi:hypothetical protein
MAVPFDIHASDEFETSWQKFSYEVGPRAAEFDLSILAAADALTKNGPGYGQRHGDASYSIAVMEGYELVYEWTTERDGHGNAVCNHLALLPIERT